jgi:hypothetical protein
MRKLILFGAVVSLISIAPVAPAAWAAPSIPTCLIANGGSGGHFTKTLLCVELVDQPPGHAGGGSYSPGDATTTHWLTESVEFRPLGKDSAIWLPLAEASQHGTGQLKAVTRTVLLPAPGALRACTKVGTGAITQTSELCSNPA